MVALAWIIRHCRRKHAAKIYPLGSQLPLQLHSRRRDMRPQVRFSRIRIEVAVTTGKTKPIRLRFFFTPPSTYTRVILRNYFSRRLESPSFPSPSSRVNPREKKIRDMRLSSFMCYSFEIDTIRSPFKLVLLQRSGDSFYFSFSIPSRSSVEDICCQNEPRKKKE